MIENLRKYTGLIIVVIVLLLLGFIFMGTSGMLRQSAGGGSMIAQVDGRSYNQSEFINLGSAPMRLIGELQGSFDFRRMTPNDRELMQYPYRIGSGAETQEAAELRFFASRIVLQSARDQFGVHPSDGEVANFIQGLSPFQSPPPVGAAPGTPGEFDQATYNAFIKKRLGSLGLGERDFQDIIRDVIATSKIYEIIGNGLGGNRELAEALVVVNAQQIEADASKIEMATFRESINPSEEDLKAYWEIAKDAYMTEKRIKVSYFIATPEYPEELKEKDEPEADPDKTPEEIAADTAASEKRATDRAEIDKKLAIAVDTFVNLLSDADGEGFDALVEGNGWTMVTTDWFTREQCPSELTIRPRSASSGKTVLDSLFQLTTGPDALAPFSKALAVGDGQWLLAKLDEIEEPRVKTFEEAETLVREHYINENAEEAIKKDVETKIAEINAAIEAGKGFMEAAKEAGLEVSELGPFTASDSLDGFVASEVFAAASTVDPGKLADPVFTPDYALIIYVKGRQIIKDDNRGQQIDSYVGNLSVQSEGAAFSAWLESRLIEANVKGPQDL